MLKKRKIVFSICCIILFVIFLSTACSNNNSVKQYFGKIYSNEEDIIFGLYDYSFKGFNRDIDIKKDDSVTCLEFANKLGYNQTINSATLVIKNNFKIHDVLYGIFVDSDYNLLNLDDSAEKINMLIIYSAIDLGSSGLSSSYYAKEVLNSQKLIKEIVVKR